MNLTYVLKSKFQNRREQYVLNNNKNDNIIRTY